ncbi:hypothetical protein JZ751_005084 [Albula glossodonta]|uniref:Uncharacterized protein n=1 Tax=Albula glossodonta TaxID=121402 RepID=A0A8T2P771_9TELE|nr:hypothetical protein JZ751_005084 [Albula glossodonta]
MTTFDDILEEAGKFGRSQKRIFALLCLVSVPWAGVYVGIVFQGFTPEHWCKDQAAKEFRETCGWDLQDARRHTIPLVNTSAGMVPSQCERYDVDWNASSLTCEDPQANFTTSMPKATCKDGWEYDYEGRVSFVTEFDLVCADAWLVDMFQATLNVGFLVGSIAIGYLADRAFYGFGVKGGWVAGYVLLTELVGVEYRRTVGVLYQMFFSVGILILPLIAYFISDWRWLQVAITAPYICFLAYYWFTSAVVYQGLIMRLGILGGNVYFDFLISGLQEFPAALLILFTIERVGRRIPFATANIVSGAACLITAFIPETVACVGRLGITMAFEMVVFVNTELYPTFVR